MSPTRSHSCTTRLAVSDTRRVGHACLASFCETAAVSVQIDTASTVMEAAYALQLKNITRPVTPSY